MTLFKLRVFSLVVITCASISSVAEPATKYPNRAGQPLCDLTFIKSYLNAISPDSCDNRPKVGGKCLSFSPTEALLMAPFLAGPGGLLANGARVVGGSIASGINAEDPRFKQDEQTNSPSRVKANRFQYQYECPEHTKHMTLNEETQGIEDEFSRDAFEDIEWIAPFCLKENTKKDENLKLDKEKCQHLDKSLALKDCQQNKKELIKNTCKKIAKNFFCKPKMLTSAKTISFMKMDADERNKILCANQELYDYYKKLLSGYTEFLQKNLKITNLVCQGNKLNSFSVESSSSENTSFPKRKNNYTVESRVDGSFSNVLARAEPRELAADYAKWKETRDKRAANIKKLYPNDETISSKYNLDPKYTVPGTNADIEPGDLYMKFENQEIGDSLKNIYFVNGFNFEQKVVAKLNSTRFQDVAKQFENSNQSSDFKNHLNLYTSFYLFADYARGCCAETNLADRKTCLKTYEGKDIEAREANTQTPKQTTPAGRRR